MDINSFLKLVEIKTKAASITPFILANLYLFYHYENFNLANFSLFFLSLLAADMGTTAVNNYQDFKRAQKKEGYNYEKHNAIVKYNLSEKTVKKTILILFSAAVIIGLILFFRTDIVVLLIGALSFLVGILYTSGPVPISRTPSGEIFSGFFMGFFISFLAIYIHNLELFNIFRESSKIIIEMIYYDIIKIFIFTLPLILGISNIMLANNICDIEDDLANDRYTLAIYIGKTKSLNLFKHLYYLSYLSIIISVILNILPVYSLLALLTYLIVEKNINTFFKNQSKKETFELAVQNFLIINYATALTLIIALIF
ncbi:1,4-dihydroxy-2-naphthoate polyprenyltransferase [Halanaerobium hydrogeniformans]|uniref:UbiA prenyltransferase n=1 Tax=Halanaerobium hydrogeniformans TaxID=656519 RepID=E4RLS4_HALHG|nr:1,4-dihydroxy-2-naphthoate polyprenyltransferase [Halanaerobium hydrogeniformans]ADQ14988.1 UbiA prenyltransferase [Halanaerobium hydrogeniformans]